MIKLKELLNEQSSAVIGGDVHHGRGGKRGMEVDDIFAGGYVATDSLKGDLTRQLTSRQQKRKDMEDALGKDNVGLEHPLGGYFDIATPALISTYEYLDQIKQAKIKYNDSITPTPDLNLHVVDPESWKELIDDTIKSFKQSKDKNKKFANTSETDMQLVDLEIK